MSQPRDPQIILETLLAAARAEGADAADALLVETCLRRVSYRLGKLEDVERGETADLGLRVFIGQQVAFVSSRIFPTTPWRRWRRARWRWPGWRRRTGSPVLPPPTLLAKDIPALDLEDNSEPSAETLIARARDVEGAAMAVTGVTNSEGGGASFSRSAVWLATSAGFSGGYAGTSHSIGVAVLAGEGTRHGARL